MLNQKLTQIIEKQIKLNNTSAGKNWKNGISTNNKEIDWNLAIYMETSELIDSTDWKWWKFKENDILNIKIELVDIFHFLVSECVRINKKNSIKEITMFIENEFNKHSADPILLNYSFIHLAKKLALHSLTLSFIKDELDPKYIENLEPMIHAFKLLVLKHFDSIESMYDLYLGKNILNNFRQTNGYNDGSYIKIWNGVEDNIVMVNLIEKFGIDELEKNLNKEYEKVKNN
jgi:hypothetical protein